MEDELRQRIAILKHELSQKDKQVEEVKEASRKLYDKNEALKNRIFELDLLGTVSINEQRKLMQEIFDLKSNKIKSWKLKESDLKTLEKQVATGQISYGKMVELINERFGF